MDHFAQTKRLYETVVKPIKKRTYRRRLDILLDYVENKKVLDLGCVEHEAAIEGKKSWWLHGLIKERAKSVKGIDYAPEAVHSLRERGYDVCVADVENMNLGEQFDVIIAGELFEHITNHRGFLESVKRHLAPGGLFVASVPNANSLNYFGQTLVFGHEVDAWDHASFFTPITFTVMLQKCGLAPVEIILYQPDEIFHHSNLLQRFAALCFNLVQVLVCAIQPSLSRGLIIVARVDGQKV